MPRPTLLATSLLAALVVVLAGVALTRGESYTLHAHFQHAGLLVKGGSVTVAGRKVGSIADIDVTPDGRADVELSIDDGEITPLREGTRAAIRAVGQAGITNRFVDLVPGPPGARELADGSVLAPEQTSDIVNLDALLDSFDPRRRERFRDLIASSAAIYAGSGAARINSTIAKLDPALQELGEVTAQMASDDAALERLVTTATRAAVAVGSRRDELRATVANTARSFGAIADERADLSDLLSRLPAVLRQARGTLASTSVAAAALRPALREVPAAARPLRPLLARVGDVLPVASPIVARLRRQVAPLADSLAGLRTLRAPSVPALRSAGRAARDSRHILRAVRFYGSDLLLGLLNGMAGVATANHGRWGHYARLAFVQPLQTLPGGTAARLLTGGPLVPGLFDFRTGLTRRCPGGNTPPAPDGSSPWVLGEELCTEAHNAPAWINDPPRLGRR